MSNTKVVCECVSKKQSKNYDSGHPIAHEIELEVPYDTNSVYHKLSGGTNIVLRTINDEAAANFTIGKKYGIVLTEEPEEDSPGEE